MSKQRCPLQSTVRVFPPQDILLLLVIMDVNLNIENTYWETCCNRIKAGETIQRTGSNSRDSGNNIIGTLVGQLTGRWHEIFVRNKVCTMLWRCVFKASFEMTSNE